MKILVTGGCGYVGSTVTDYFLKKGLEIIALDILWFNKNVPKLFENNPYFKFYKQDIRDTSIFLEIIKKESVDYIIHAAAIVGDPASKLFPELTKEINEIATIKMIDMLNKTNIKGFIFLSTCSNYGVSKYNTLVNEESDLNPTSLYASTKVNVERYLLNTKTSFKWIICRVPTLYGISYRMRFDLTVNEFMLKAFTDKLIDIYKPESYRPYLHVKDLASILFEIINNFILLSNNVFNVGFLNENYKKIEIAELVRKFIPDTNIKILSEGGDNRDYKVDFTKLHRFIKINQLYDIEKGMKEIYTFLKNNVFADTNLDMFYNTKPKFEE
ncbi:MAG: NAD-dependent epimerase/dehydratase family protein [bacterium]